PTARASPATTARATRASLGDGENTSLECGVGRITSLAHARHPIDSVLQKWRDGRAVLWASDEYTVMRHDHLLELECVGGLSGARIDIRVVNGQRIVGKGNAGDFDIEKRELFYRQCRQPDVVGAGTYRAWYNEDFRDRHQRLRFRGR